MYKYFDFCLFSNSVLSLRRLCWIVPLLVILLAACCLRISPLQFNINNYKQQNENPDRTIALFSPREIQSVSSTKLEDLKYTFSHVPIDHVLYVISLDGRITAIDVRQKGTQLWTANTGAPLIISTLSKIEISHDSKSVRLIPSLIGGLYEKSAEDEQMKPLPFDAESLLNASFQFHDELIMTGGKDIDTLGLNLHTGKVMYSFSKDDIDQTTSDNTCSAPILIVRRIKQIVRARSARNGYEKWNFSVSNHELIHLYAPSSSENLDQIDTHYEQPAFFEYRLQTGVILAFDHTNHLLWTSTINSSIAAVWELKNGHSKEKSLFRTKLSRRVAFMGKFNSTPYVIIPPRTQRQLIHHTRKNNIPGSIDNGSLVLSSWRKANEKRLLSVSSIIPENDGKPSSTDRNYPIAVRQDESSWDTAGYLELIDPNGSITEEEKNELPVHVNTDLTWISSTSLLNVSSICLGALIIIAIWSFKHSQMKIQQESSIIPEKSDTTLEYQLSEPSFESRYILEYEHVRFLGRGGFGVVFEAINKLDERRVAIKRVALKKSSGKERALKEIRCLAVLNHPNLIQYYYAWNESPPSGWQEEEDDKLIIRNTEVTRDSLSIFPASGSDSESAIQVQSAKHFRTSSLSSVIDFTFERSLNPPRVLEESNSSNEGLSDSDDKSVIEEENCDCPRTYFYFVMQLCQSESLRDRLIKQSVTQSQAWSIFDQIIKSIEYIHSQKLIHRDLKPSNILFSMDDTVKIGDFGLVSAFGEDKIEDVDHAGNNELGGTILYMSPEQINRQSYNQKVDIYAIGIILFELLCPFSTQMERVRALKNIRLQAPVFPIEFECNQLICGLIRWLLAYSPHDRPKASELRQDSYLQDMLKDNVLSVAI